MVKSIVITAIIHVILFSLIWVGFPVPGLREKVQFYYFGSDVVSEEFQSSPAAKVPIKAVGVDDAWIKKLDFNKPKR